MTLNWILAIVGLIGIPIHATLDTLSNGKKQIGDVIQYFKDNSLNTIVAVLCYAAVIVLWLTNGLDILGLVQGKLTGMTVFIAYGAVNVFKSIADANAKLTAPPIAPPTVPPVAPKP